MQQVRLSNVIAVNRQFSENFCINKGLCSFAHSLDSNVTISQKEIEIFVEKKKNTASASNRFEFETR